MPIDTYSYFTDPGQEYFLQLQRDKRARDQNVYEQYSQNPQFLNMLAENAVSFPVASAELSLALAAGGIPASSPTAQQIVNDELAVRDTLGPTEEGNTGWWNDLTSDLAGGLENTFSAVKGSARWAFGIMDAAYQFTAGGAIPRTIQHARTEGISELEAWKDQDPFIFEALGGVFNQVTGRGGRVNLTSGWFPGSDLSDSVSEKVNIGMQELERSAAGLGANERNKKVLEGSPEVWSQAVEGDAAQAALGKPIVPMNYADTSGVMFNVDPWMGGGQVQTAWSPSRLFTANILEPGTEPFKKVSGTGDFMSQLFLDPTDWVGIGWAKSGVDGRKVWATGRKAVQANDAAKAGQLALPAGAPNVTKALPDGGPLPRALTGDPSGPPQIQNVNRRVTGVDSDGFAIVEDVLEETSAVLTRGQDPATMADAGRKIPWWLSPTESAKRVVTAIDPPEWFIDLHRGTRQGAATTTEGNKFVRKQNGVYDLDLPTIPGQKQQRLRVIRRGKGEWEVLRPDGTYVKEKVTDPRFTEGNAKFRTLKEAKEVAQQEVARTLDEDIKVYGMSTDEFAASGEDVFLNDYMDVANMSNPKGANQPNRVHLGSEAPGVGRTTAKGENAQARVFGKTADLGGDLNELPRGLRQAMHNDRLISSVDDGRLMGWGDPSMESWDETLRWMENNGYGKIKLGDGNVVINDNMIGGNPLDQLGRMWFDDGEKAIHSSLLGPTPTPNTINEFVDGVEELRRVPGEGNADFVQRLKEVDMENAAPSKALDDARPQLAPGFELHGKKADRLVDAVVSAVEGGGHVLDEVLHFLEKAGTPVPNYVKRALMESTDRETTRRLLAQWLVEDGVSEVLLPGGNQYGRLSKVVPQTGFGNKMPTNFKRRMATAIGGKATNMVEDPSAAYRLYEKANPHFNVERGGKVPLYLEDGTKTDQFINVEDVFDRLRNLKTGHKAEAFDIQADFQKMYFSALMDANPQIDTRLAERASKWWIDNKEFALYEAERLGRVDLSQSAHDLTNINDNLMGFGPQITADLWGGNIVPVPARELKRIASESDLLGRISNRFSHKWEFADDGTIKMHEKAAMRAMDFTIGKLWKPLVLLRGAWTLRILMDDQFRMAAEGKSMFNHPLRIFNYALAHPGDWGDAFRKGSVDVFGQSMTIKNMDNLDHADSFRAMLMSKRGQGNFEVGTFGAGHHVRAEKGSGQYVDGLSMEVRRLQTSPLTRKLARSKADDPVDEAVRWLKGEGGEKEFKASQQELANQAALHRGIEGTPEKILAGDVDVLTDIVNRQYGILHEKAGGTVVMDTGKGELMAYRDVMVKVGDTPVTDGKARWIVQKEGDKDVLDVIRGNNKTVGNLESEESMQALSDLLRPKVRGAGVGGPFPDQVRVVRSADQGASADVKMMDKAVGEMFNWLMTIPSNKFSRVPEFQKAYWEKVSELYPFMSKELKAQVDELAVGMRAKELLTKAKKDKRMLDIEGQLTDMSQVDEHAKAYGLTMVEKTLFNLTNDKANVSDSLRIIFPFVEAWGEFITRWSRLMLYGDRNIKNTNRLRQTVMGARRSGFFEENDYGQEVFNYPAFLTKAQVGLHNTLNNIPFAGEKLLGADVSPEVADSIQAQGSVESLNFASGVIPGFGPIFQTGVRVLPNNPDLDWIRDIVAPFGTDGNLAASFLPAYMKRIVSAHEGSDDPQLKYALNSAIQDVMTVMIDRGDFAGVTNEADIMALTREAEKEGAALLMVRAGATFWNPASPQYKFQKEDEDGLVWSYNNLSTAWYEMKQENGGDEAATYKAWHERFGFLPHAFTNPKTYKTADRSMTESGYKFERAQPALFEEYPGMAMYLDPNLGVESEYDHSAMVNQLRESLREGYTAEQRVYVQQDQLGDMWWANVKENSVLIEHGDTRRAFETAERERIEKVYPYWNKPVPGKRQQITNDQQMEEVARMLEDPKLVNSPVLEPVRIYLAKRDEVLGVNRSLGGSSISGAKSLDTELGQVSTHGRAFLREVAESLAVDWPQFEPLFRTVYASEIHLSHDAPVKEQVAFGMFGEETDIFEQLGLTSGG